MFTRWGKVRVCFEIYRVGGLLIFRRIGEVWRGSTPAKKLGVDLDNFRFGELFADYVRWNRVKNSRGPFSSRNKGKEGSLGGEGTKFPYVLYSYFHKIYTGIPVGQLLLCRRSLTWDKGLGSVLAAGDLDRSLENHRVFHENLYIRRWACDLHTGGPWA